MALLQPNGGRSALTLAVVWAVMSLPLLPPQHLHRAGIEGRTEPLVHVHFTNHPEPSTPPSGAAARSVSHGDHRLALFLGGDYTTPETSIGGAFLRPTPGVVSQPPRDMQRLVLRRNTHRIHGPPRFVSITRAPPILS
jgi:hypothetical protein